MWRSTWRLCAAAASAKGPVNGLSFFAKPKSSAAANGNNPADQTAAPGSNSAPSSTATEPMQSKDDVPSASLVPQAFANAVMPPPRQPVIWADQPTYADLGDELRVRNEGYQQPIPLTYLSARCALDIQPAEQLLQECAQKVAETYKGVDVRDPSSVPQWLDATSKKSLTLGDQVRTVTEFISGQVAHQVALQEWRGVFDLKYVEMDTMFYLWTIHNYVISRRFVNININRFAHRREVLQELQIALYDAYENTAAQVIGRPATMEMKVTARKRNYAFSLAMDEAMNVDGPGGDLMLMSVFMQMSPLPRPEDIPMFTYYTLVHYVRFHCALFDRLSDDDVCKGNFHFLPPNDPRIFTPYSEVEMDNVARSWMAEAAGGADQPPSPAASA